MDARCLNNTGIGTGAPIRHVRVGLTMDAKNFDGFISLSEMPLIGRRQPPSGKARGETCDDMVSRQLATVASNLGW